MAKLNVGLGTQCAKKPGQTTWNGKAIVRYILWNRAGGEGLGEEGLVFYGGWRWGLRVRAGGPGGWRVTTGG